MRYLVIDVETTGLRPAVDRIVELAFVDISRFCTAGISPSMQQLEAKRFMFNPEMPIPVDASRIHGIQDKDVVGKPSFQEHASDLHAQLLDAVLVGHHVRFDINFLIAEFERQGIRFRPNWVCTLQDAQRLLPDLESHKLEALNRHFGLSSGRAHRAAADAKTTALLYFSLRALAAAEVLPTSGVTTPSLPAPVVTTNLQSHLGGNPRALQLVWPPFPQSGSIPKPTKKA